jgi:hypothetical protein
MPSGISFSMHVNREFGIGYVVRKDRPESGHTFTYLLSRRSGLWINCTEQEIQEHNMPSECIFPLDELPESSQVGGD